MVKGGVLIINKDSLLRRKSMYLNPNIYIDKTEQIMNGGLYFNRFFWVLAALFPKHDVWYEQLSAEEIRLASKRNV